MLAFAAGADFDAAHAQQMRGTVLDGVLDDRLQRKRRQPRRQQRLRQRYRDLQPIGEARFLNLQVGVHMLNLVRQADFIIRTFEVFTKES